MNELDSKPDYDADDFTDRRAIMDLCELLETADIAKFVVKGFDKPNSWVLSIDPDLSTILEDLPDKLNSMTLNQYPIKLSFYEQTVMRHIISHEEGRSLSATCVGWSRKPYREVGKESVEKATLDRQLRKLKHDFIHCVTTAFPKRSGNKFFLGWCNSFKD